MPQISRIGERSWHRHLACQLRLKNGLEYLFSANGAAFKRSLGQRPRDLCNTKDSALKARIHFVAPNRRVESRFQRLFPLGQDLAAASCYEHAPLALNTNGLEARSPHRRDACAPRGIRG
jgi:hypothetical protein